MSPARPDEQAPFRPTAADILMLQAIHHHGPLSSIYLAEFRKEAFASEQKARRRLTTLAHERNTVDGGPYLSRPFQQKLTEYSHSKHLVYDLTPASVACLQRLGLWHNKAPSDRNPWTHAFMVACITASIELTCRRHRIDYIHGHEILNRAGATLRQPVCFDWNGQKTTIDLIPDALFALEYPGGGGFRAFLVEADRRTEPITATSVQRKSMLRNLLQYRCFVELGGYREAYGLNANVKVLSVCSHPAREEASVALVRRHLGSCAWLCFQSAPSFGLIFSPPPVLDSLTEKPWRRVGYAEFLMTD